MNYFCRLQKENQNYYSGWIFKGYFLSLDFIGKVKLFQDCMAYLLVLNVVCLYIVSSIMKY